MKIRTFKIALVASWILLLTHSSGVASPGWIVHNWTIPTPVGRLGFQEAFPPGGSGEMLVSAMSGRQPETERYFCLGLVGRVRTSLSSSSVWTGCSAVMMLAVIFLPSVLKNVLRKRVGT